jgi:PPOX class probable F420-dependent enzyme
MAFPDSHLDLLKAPATAALTTLLPDGSPHTTAVWYLLDGDGQLKISLATDRKKYDNIVARPHVNLFFLDPANPFRTLEVRATAEIAPDLDFVFRNKVGEHYGTDVSTFDKPNAVRVVVTLHPTKVVANG